MKNIFFGLLTILLAMSACDRNKNISSENELPNNVISSSEIEILEFTQEYVVPGIQSSLRGTQKYKIVLKSNFKDSTKIESFYVDSIAIPVNSILVNGKRWKASDLLIGEIKELTVFASRNLYSSSEELIGNRELNEIKYELSGRVLPVKEGALVYSTNKDDAFLTTVFPLGEYVKKENVYRP